ncbi:MAG: D-glycero-beta-D-manno-heptose 1-phosphate adenylyltransferase [Phycisphaerae bacterium]|nr:D-glycero-beta-D-manno-heptose 1-phosphate adenylyltransferase [Phycisphaerae bacterium]
MSGRTRQNNRLTVDTDELIRLVDAWQPCKIVVVGDFMLDRYVYGNADRLSPDAPVPVLTVEDRRHNAGGAASVCLNLRALNCKVTAMGVVGRDDAGRELKTALKTAGCDTTGMITATDRPTTVKENFVGLAQHRHPQKMFRVDDEVSAPVPPATRAKLLAKVRQALRGAGALCLEDYNKGVLGDTLCRKLIAMARAMRVPVFVDPAAIEDYGKYRGATCITPNRTEASTATGMSTNRTAIAPLRDMAGALLRDLHVDAVVLTLDKQGAMLARKRCPPVIVPTQARAVYDVTGAGDMVLAMIAAARVRGATYEQATALANVAAGLEVERFGVVPIELGQVLLALLDRRGEALGKLRTVDQLLPELTAHRRIDEQGNTKHVVFTNGCFDILHAGHVRFLRQARQQGDLLVVAINSDRSIRRIKGADRPINRLADRIMVLSELESVDYVVVFDEDTPMRLLRAIRPDVLVKGAPYTRKTVIGADLVESYGGRVYLARHIKGKSTTNIIDRIAHRRAP